MRVTLYLLCLLLVLSVFTGCQTEQDPGGISSTNGGTESLAQTEPSTEPVPQGSLETDPLQIVSPDDPRIMDSSASIFAETENGYYLKVLDFLYYADKSDLSFWVPLCSKPNCKHYDPDNDEVAEACDAYLCSDFIRKGDRLYYVARGEAKFTSTWYFSPYLVSSALDGTDKQVVFHFQEVEDMMSLYGAGGNFALKTDHFFSYYASMNNEGTYDRIALMADESGVHELYSGTGEEETKFVRNANAFGMRGDTAYYIADLENSYTTIYRIQDYQLVGTDLGDLPLYGSYLSGDRFQYFRRNEGYFDVDLTTMAETKLSEPQLENSHAVILQPNCILESTLICLDYFAEKRDFTVDQHELRFFDGQSWHEVTLPPELLHAEDSIFLFPQALGSDRILLNLVDNAGFTADDETLGTMVCYQILLGTDTPTLEYMGTIRLPGT